MDYKISKEHLAHSCYKFSTTAPEALWNLPMCMKEKTKVGSIDEEESACSDNNMYPSEPSKTSMFGNDSKDYVFGQLKMEFPDVECPQSHYPSEPLEPSEFVNYYDSKEYAFEQVKEEFSEDNYPQLHVSMNSKIGFEVTVKMEKLEKEDLLYNAQVISIHYDALVTPQEVQCKLCARVFKNSFNLLKHNNDHIKIVINSPVDNVVNELNRCQYQDKVFNNSDKMLTHASDVLKKNKSKDKLCRIKSKSALNLKRQVALLRKFQNSPNLVTKNSVKCKYCNAEFKYKKALKKHMKLCPPGKKDEEMKYKCHLCESIYRNKDSLTLHIKRMHYDYGRTFECWCGKQFRTPVRLSEHKRTRHGANNEVYKCEYCKAVFNVKSDLIKHIQRMHYDYGIKFECWCGKQFRTPIHLRVHKSRQHTGNMKVQCDYCQKFYKYKHYLLKHILMIHFDRGKVFKCWCGKQFRAPIHLRRHMRRQHDRKMKDKK